MVLWSVSISRIDRRWEQGNARNSISVFRRCLDSRHQDNAIGLDRRCSFPFHPCATPDKKNIGTACIGDGILQTCPRNLDTWHQDAKKRPVMNGVPPVKYHVGRGTRARPSQPIYSQWFAETRKDCQRPVGLSHVCAHEGRMWGPEELQPPASSQDLVMQARVFATPCFSSFAASRLPCSTQGPAHLWSFLPCLGFSFTFSLPSARHPRQDTSTALGLRLCSVRPCRCGCQAFQACHQLSSWLSHHISGLILTCMGLRYAIL